jgi:phosphopantothenoylcysteine synthetase/decarboxylase
LPLDRLYFLRKIENESTGKASLALFLFFTHHGAGITLCYPLLYPSTSFWLLTASNQSNKQNKGQAKHKRE